MATQAELMRTIDEALERFGSRDLVAGSEILDFLLDLRLTVRAVPDELERLLEEQSEPATT